MRDASSPSYAGVVLNRDYDGQVCSIAGTLELVGDRWTLLIVRDMLLGLRRFDELLQSLGLASNVLTDRLGRLVDEGIAERHRYSERPERFEYRLTRKGRDLGLVLMALMQWGDHYIYEKPPRVARRRSDRSPVSVAMVSRDGAIVAGDEVELLPGPGAGSKARRRKTSRPRPNASSR